MNDESKTKAELLLENKELHQKILELEDFIHKTGFYSKTPSFKLVRYDIKLADIIDSGTIQSLMDDLYAVTKMGIGILDMEGNILVGTGWQDICTKFHRVHPETRKYCIESDTVLSKKIKLGEFKAYKCKNNMWDIATPILIEDKQLGNVFLGQFFYDDEKIDYELFEAQAEKYGFDRKQYRAALESVPRWSRKQVKNLMAFYSKFAKLISEIGYNNLMLSQLITERKTAEIALKRSEEKFKTVADFTYDWEYWIGPEGNYIYVSPSCERITGYKVEDFINDPHLLEKITHPYDQEMIKSHMESELDQREIFSLEFRIIDAENKMRWIGHICQSVYSDEGVFLGRRASNRDITDSKKADLKLNQLLNELENSNKELEQFAYVVSHDLQEPLRMVSSFTKLIEQRYQGKLDSDADEFIEYIIDGTNRMQQLIIDLLQYSRITTRGKDFQMVDCAEILKNVLINLKVSIDENEAIIHYDALPTINADSSQLTQLFQNLISNALKFRSKKTPEIHIFSKEKENGWIFYIKDNGIGISPQYHEKIFDIFQRLHSKDKYSGTGIGLAVCKRIVERHGGNIWVESEIGRGSTFVFTMPMKTVGEEDK